MLKKYHLFNIIGFGIIFLSFALFPFKQGLLNGCIIVIGLIGLGLWCHQFKQYWSAAKKSGFLLLVCLFYLPMWLSLIDTVSTLETLKTLFGFLRYICAFSLLFYLCQSPQYLIRLSQSISGLMLIWCLDALIQLNFGQNLLGIPYDGYRVTGIFGAKYHLGYILALLSPIFLEVLRRDFFPFKTKRWFILPLLGILVATIIVSNTRAAWLSFAASFVIWSIWNIWQKHIALKTILLLIIAMSIAIGLALQTPAVQTRMLQSAKALSGDVQGLNEAGSARISLWKTAIVMFKERPLFGIGVGSAHHAYAQKTYAERGNQDYAYFPHLFILEVMLETGVIGLLSYLLFYLGLLYLLLKQTIQAEWLMVTCIAIMPLNTHLALYGSYASSLIWFPLIIGLSLGKRKNEFK